MSITYGKIVLMANILKGRGLEFSTVSSEIITQELMLTERTVGTDILLASLDGLKEEYERLLGLSDAEIDTHVNDEMTARLMNDPYVKSGEDTTRTRGELFGEIGEYGLTLLLSNHMTIGSNSYRVGNLIMPRIELQGVDDDVTIGKSSYFSGKGFKAEPLEERDFTIGNLAIDRLHTVLEGLRKI
jgi:hypothetical protein